ncbi:GFA family protein [Lentibacter algarum]|uniref:GFA family protein n=1 Tax=Lentibacter algarum TaxID=576131 RepID=UPI001C06B75D|nr:GFA family protein [Lentibacter algarum]MBU2981114.1 GFA family protein [Lentibacter algarum]
MTSGTCLCGACRFETSAPPLGPSMCHCALCRAQSGGVWSSAYVARADLHISGPVKWFASSANARRGFCPDCGSFLFWEALDETTTSFSLGSIKNPTGIKLEKHIFTANKGDYYDITDGLPQKE